MAQPEHVKSKRSLMPDSSVAQWTVSWEAVHLVVWPFNSIDGCTGFNSPRLTTAS